MIKLRAGPGRATVVYDLKLLRARHRVTVRAGGAWRWRTDSVRLSRPVQATIEYPQMAGAAFLLPGSVNGYGTIEKRLTRIERGLGIKAGR